MAIASLDEAETSLSSLAARVEAGEEIVIARGEEPIVRLTVVTKPKRRLSGACRTLQTGFGRLLLRSPSR